VADGARTNAVRIRNTSLVLGVTCGVAGLAFLLFMASSTRATIVCLCVYLVEFFFTARVGRSVARNSHSAGSVALPRGTALPIPGLPLALVAVLLLGTGDIPIVLVALAGGGASGFLLGFGGISPASPDGQAADAARESR
jgi:hypothetical protein